MAEGTLKVRVTTSNALLPLHGVPVVISRDDGNGKRTLLAVKTTDQNGDIPPPKVETPSLSESQSSGQGELPFTQLIITADAPGYYSIEVDDAQVFPDTTSIQNLELLPSSTDPNLREEDERFSIQPQNL